MTKRTLTIVGAAAWFAYAIAMNAAIRYAAGLVWGSR